MGYFVAQTLKMRPMDILTGWSCEELLVSYGYYANQKSNEAFELTSPKERRRKKMTEIDRWAMPFVTQQQIGEMEQKKRQSEPQENDMDKIAEVIFGI